MAEKSPSASKIGRFNGNKPPPPEAGRRGGLKIPCANNTCGFDPHHRHKKEALQLVWGAFFLSAACERVEQHCTRSQKKRPDFVGTFLFYMRYIPRAPAVLFRLIPPLQGVFFAARIYSRSAARHFRKRPPVLPKGRTIPEKKASKPCSDHLFNRFLPILQCFL